MRDADAGKQYVDVRAWHQLAGACWKIEEFKTY